MIVDVVAAGSELGFSGVPLTGVDVDMGVLCSL